MSIGRVVVTWGDEDRVFDLQPLRWLRELETKTGVGAFKLLTLLRTGEWKVDHVRHVIRTGLLGGMSEPNDTLANTIMSTQFDNRPIMQNVPLAVTILAAGLFGGSEPSKKAEAKADEAETTDESPSPNFTEVAQS